MNETSKALRRLATDPMWLRVSQMPKPWLDIGPGDSPLAGADPYDKAHGDANTLSNLEDGYYNLIWSSHCLEHMKDAELSLRVWWDKLKPGGFMWLQVPDAVLYEHRRFPSKFNADHKWMFSTLRTRPFGTDKHHNLVDLVWGLRDCELIRLQLVDTHYDYNDILSDQTMKPDVEAGIEMVLRKNK